MHILLLKRWNSYWRQAVGTTASTINKKPRYPGKGQDETLMRRGYSGLERGIVTSLRASGVN